MARPSSTKGEPITPEQARNSLPSDEHQQAIDDIYDEAKLWLDGKPITTEAEAEGVEKLLAMSRKAWSEADDSRAAEKKPFDDAGKEVQKRYKPLLEKAERISGACKTLLTPWRLKVAEEQRKQAEETKRIADELAQRAAQVREDARGDLGAMEIADGVSQDAERIAKTAGRLERNAGKGLGLRTEYDVVISDRREALLHYNRTNPTALDELVLQLARDDVRRGIRTISGFTITERKGAF